MAKPDIAFENVANAFLVCLSDYYYKNRIFDIASSQNRDHAYEPYHLLRQMFHSRGVTLNTYDYFYGHPCSEPMLLFIDIPNDFERIMQRHPDARAYLLLIESAIISPRSWDLSKHRHFRKVFTWSDELTGTGSNYVKIQVPSWFPEKTVFPGFAQRRLCVMIAGNKRSCAGAELYSERVAVIRWFEAHRPDDFDLYGFGWDERVFSGPRLFRMLNRSRLLCKLTAPGVPSYRGKVSDKVATFANYRFAICYENVRDVPGYITEKIFDCFFAGCVPVYWGANNIADYIPKECFIDRREFPDMEHLYDYMAGMNEQQYMRYIASIDAFLRSRAAHQFTADSFAATIVEGMLD